MKVNFNQPYSTGLELKYLKKVFASGQLSGNGALTKRCQEKLQLLSASEKCLLTTSCTSALEMCALLLNIEPGDEVIIPAYTFVSTANAFAMHGAKIVLVDSKAEHPGIDEDQIEPLINKRTKAIVPVHYAGVACDMEKIMSIANKYGLAVVEDAAQGIDATFKWNNGQTSALGSIGHLGAYSFHETKNIQCGEGGALLINDPDLLDRAEIISENGTNKASFLRGEVDKYDWIEIGSSFLPSELTAAYLYAQLQELETIQEKRSRIWNQYSDGFNSLLQQKRITGPHIPDYASNNAHMFYLVCRNQKERDSLISDLQSHGINSAFHYQTLHRSPFFKNSYQGKALDQADKYTECLVRLPLHFNLTTQQVNYVIDKVNQFMGIDRS